MFGQHSQPVICLAVVALGMAASIGCRARGRVVDHRFTQLSQDVVTAQQQPAYAVAAANPVADELSGPHSVEEYIHIGLQQNSEIQEVRLMVESLAHRVPQAASLPDPMLGATVFPAPVQTAAGEQEFALAMNQKVPWRGKLATQAAMAEDEVKAARARLAAVELKVVEQIKKAYFQLYFVQQAISIVQSDRRQLETIEVMVGEMYKVGKAVQQDLLQVHVALSRLDTELAQFQQQKASTQARLARLLHISPETDLQATDRLPQGKTVQDVNLLYELAIQSRPELHAQLATIQRDRRAACLAELQNYPDMTFGFNWIATSNDGISPVANGDDAVLLTLGMNLPVYRKRIDAGVREAQTRALSNARKYDRLKDEAMEEVADSFAKINSLQETLRLFRDVIIRKQDLALQQSISDYSVGKVDFLQMLENWRQLLRYHIQEKRFETDLQQALAALARQIGDFDVPAELAPANAPGQVVPIDLDENRNDSNDQASNIKPSSRTALLETKIRKR